MWMWTLSAMSIAEGKTRHSPSARPCLVYDSISMKYPEYIMHALCIMPQGTVVHILIF